MFGKIPNVNATVTKSYTSKVQRGSNSIHNVDIYVSDSFKKQESTSSKLDIIIHKLSYGKDISYEEYAYVKTIDINMAENINKYREFRNRIAQEFACMEENAALSYYKDLRKKYQIKWYDDIWSQYYGKAIDCVWYENLKIKEKRRINYRF